MKKMEDKVTACDNGYMDFKLKKRFTRWMEDNRGLILTVFGLPASFLFDMLMQVNLTKMAFI